MNYRHAFHAGNFADVLKHAVTAYCARYLARKDASFVAVDTHAGLGWYDLAGEEARRSPEWRDGVGRLWDARKDTAGFPPPAAEFLAPYLEVIAEHNAGAALALYPGSPALLASLTRPQDRVVLGELHPADARTLALRYETDPRVTVRDGDGYATLKALVPPPERRGLVLVDPPFEDPDEMAHMAQAAKDALERWPTGVYVFWRPLKDLWAAERFDVGLAEWLIAERDVLPEKILRADLWVRDLDTPGPLAGAGVVVVNPPHGLEEGLLAALPWLTELFRDGASVGEGAGWRLDGAITEDSLMVDEF